ncbi:MULTISPECIES: peptidase MA family metallohydrolase [Clostridium]|uniref:peptidase MA family metallohydrolase n=1 Tax=Clostridium TaxID=1485 RepID=UPI0018AB5A4D|nr:MULTISPECIES: peptidase MA family metallohydrolase [Clostridium]MDB1968140.1 peptidase MA family metallohydrolase [Clostridium tertium]MDU1276962.1 peptidase MA family metallohydrolase [Clostridium sp.]MDU2458647.1 peptidase MA family metallohydrolase [Clostridium sp.]MDU3406023.1 peptidase MA family metallohydrolase [Clostridium sp.]MDU3523559.1 peptidase MA family metallohydrolase [Clostridium sp.]
MNKKASILGIFILIMIIIITFGYRKLGTIEDKIKLQEEDKYFKYYSNENYSKAIKELSEVLNDNYSAITERFDTNLETKVEITIYPNIKEFHKAIGNEDASDGIVGVAYDNTIKMVSPLNPGSIHNKESLLKVIVHEFVHIVTFNINNKKENNIPTWFMEGISVYEANQITDYEKKAIRENLSQNTDITIDDINDNFYNNQFSYLYSGSIVGFIVNEFGYEKLIQVIKSPNDIENILDLSIEELKNNWINYVEKNYK